MLSPDFFDHELYEKLEELKEEHAGLETDIERLALEAMANEFEIRRLKKKKLQLKDEIARLEALLYPDLVA